MKHTELKHNLLAFFAIAGVCFLFFQFMYPYHLFFKEQIQLFLYTPTFLHSYFSKPAALACLCGDFLIQFFYWRGGGPLILATLFSAEWWLVKTILQKNLRLKNAALWALLPVTSDFTAHLALLYTPRNTLSLLLVLILFMSFSRINNKAFATTLFIILAAVGHWLFGNAIIILPFLLLFSTTIYRPKILTILLLLIVAISVYIRRPFYLLPVKDTFLYPAFSSKEVIPLIVFVATIFISQLTLFEKKYNYFSIWTVSVLLPVICIAGFKLYANFGFEKLLALDSETYFGNNKKVLKLAEKAPVHNRIATYYTNMVLAKKGELPDRLLEFYQPSTLGLLLPVSQDESWQTILFSNEFFYLIGDMNLAQHSSMLGNTFSPYNRSSRMIKRLAEINLVNEDYVGAEKFLRMLEKTLFHKRWAKQRLKVNSESSPNWLVSKRLQIAHTDTIRNSSDYLQAIEYLVQQNTGNKIALDYLLCYHLLNKDLTSFKGAYDRYAKPLNFPAHKTYAEALLISLFKEKAPEETFQEYKIDPAVLSEFINYTSRFEETKGDLNLLKEKYGTSYWFYYHFATMKEVEK